MENSGNDNQIGQDDVQDSQGLWAAMTGMESWFEQWLEEVSRDLH